MEKGKGWWEKREGLRVKTLKVYKLIHYQFIIKIYFNRGQTFYSYKHQ